MAFRELYDGAAARRGVKTIGPLIVTAVPFGLVLGVSIVEAAGVNNLLGWATSAIIFAGASQLATISLLDEGASAAAIVATVWAINARHLMYSAALSTRFRALPSPVRWVAAYFMIDQVFAVSDQLGPEVPPPERISFYAAAGVFATTVWHLSVVAGMVAGNAIPASWSLDFAVPLMFGSLAILAMHNRPGVLAALIAGILAVAGRDLPRGTGLIIAIVVGVAAGGIAETIALRRADSDPASKPEPDNERAT